MTIIEAAIFLGACVAGFCIGVTIFELIPRWIISRQKR